MKYKVMFDYRDPYDYGADEPLYVTAQNKKEAHKMASYYIRAWQIDAKVGTIDRMEE